MWISLLACAWHVAAPEGAIAPLSMVERPGENRPFVEIDGRVWLVDTGYSRTTCDDTLVAELGAEVRGGGLARGEAGTVKVGRTVLDEVVLGGWRFARMPCAVRDLQTTSSVGEGVAGVIGSNVLRHFRLDIRFSEATVRLDRSSLPRPAGAASLRPEGGFGPRRVARLVVDDRTVDVVPDTGADRTYLPLHDGVVLSRYTGIRQGTGPTGQVEVEVVFRAVEDVHAGPLVFPITSYVERSRPPCFPNGPAWLPEAWRVGECPLTSDEGRAGLLGMDALGGERLLLDYRARWLYRE